MALASMGMKPNNGESLTDSTKTASGSQSAHLTKYKSKYKSSYPSNLQSRVSDSSSSQSQNKAAAVAIKRSASFFARAVEDYNRADYKVAELALRQAIAEYSADPSAHYYLANTLVHLNRHEEALEEFRRAYKIDPFGPTSGYCRKAMQAYAKASQPPSAQTNLETNLQTAFKSTGSSKASLADETADLDATTSILRYSKIESGERDPQDKLAVLRAQAEREKSRHQIAADAYARAMNTTGEGEAQQIRLNAKEQIEQILHGGRNNLPWIEQAAQAQAAEVQRNADEMEKLAHERAVERALEYKSVSKSKGRALDETVSNLERQLVTKTLPGTPSLRHEGTDLFVRSYAPSLEKSPYPPAHAAVARINPVLIETSKDTHRDTPGHNQVVVEDAVTQSGRESRSNDAESKIKESKYQENKNKETSVQEEDPASSPDAVPGKPLHDVTGKILQSAETSENSGSALKKLP